MPKARRKGQPIVKVRDGSSSQANSHQQQANQNGANKQGASAGGQPQKKRSHATAFNSKHANVDSAHNSQAKHKRPKLAPGTVRPRQQQRANSQQHAGRPLQAQSVVDRQAAYAVQALVQADEGRGNGVTLKSLTLAPHITAKKATYKVTCEVLKYLAILKEVVSRAGLDGGEAGIIPHKVSPYTCYVLCYELLIGEGLHQRGPAERAVLKSKEPLQKALSDLMAERGASEVSNLVREEVREFPGVPHPRWVRVNTLKMSVDDALAQLQQVYPAAARDPLIPELLALPPGTALHNYSLVMSGALVLQGKSSCMPAAALDPCPGWTVVDCCAAPGNKTTHLAARMQGQGRVFAFDRDPRRLSRLVANVKLTGSTNVVAPQEADFLSVDTQAPEYAQVQGLLLDPSCSGSGTVYSRMDHLLPSWQTKHARQSVGAKQQQKGLRDGVQQGEAGDTGDGTGQDASSGQGGAEGDERARITQLATFQVAALRHALTFPALERLVYSTCSVHREENEDVVAAVLEQATQLGFELQDPFPSWPRRGLPLFPGCEKLIRTDAHEDGTDGFFVALFQRRPSSGVAAKQEVDGKKTAVVRAGSKAAKRKGMAAVFQKPTGH